MRATVRTTAVAALAAITASLAPLTVSAQTPAARVVLYEVTESLRMGSSDHDRDDDAGLSRLAHASLLGKSVVTLAGSPFGDVTCTSGGQTKCYMTATASSAVPWDPGTGSFPTPGTIHGSFDVLQPIHGPGQFLTDLGVVASGQLSGTLDLRPVLAFGFAPVGGQWSLEEKDTERHEHSRGRDSHGGRFSGVFLIPFYLALPGELAGNYYWQELPAAQLLLDDDVCLSHTIVPLQGFGRVCKLAATESVLDFPLTKAVISLQN